MEDLLYTEDEMDRLLVLSKVKDRQLKFPG